VDAVGVIFRDTVLPLSLVMLHRSQEVPPLLRPIQISLAFIDGLLAEDGLAAAGTRKVEHPILPIMTLGIVVPLVRLFARLEAVGPLQEILALLALLFGVLALVTAGDAGFLLGGEPPVEFAVVEVALVQAHGGVFFVGGHISIDADSRVDLNRLAVLQ